MVCVGESIPHKEISQKEDITEFKSRSLAKCLLNTFIPGGDSAEQSLIEAWEVGACQVVCVWGLVSRGIGRSGLGRPRPFG